MDNEKLKPYIDEKDTEYYSDGEIRPVTPDRRDSESSAERSQYHLEDAMSKSTPHLKEYGFYYTRSHLDYKVCDPEKNVIYFADFHEFRSRPDVELRQGEDKTAPIVAVASFRWSRDLKLGVGDPGTNERDVVWEDMKNISRGIGHSKYRFEMTINNERRSFLWQRTRDTKDGVEGMGKIANWNYKLVDEKTGETVAVYLENFLKSWQKKGKLQLKADFGRNWELLVLLGSLGLCLKASRRARRRSNAAAASSGGGG
jgi:hypothetical protein